MPRYKHYDYNQTSMVVINFEEQIQPGTFEYALHHLISDRLDLTPFDDLYCNDGKAGGRPAYDPAILLKIILFAYSKGITSSREIQWCCEHNIIFKALSCDSVPHFTTIAAFVSSYPLEIEHLFEQILLVCDQEGLLGKELFAIDGCKLPSNASKEWSGTFKELAEKRDKIQRQIRYWMSEHDKTDKDSDDNRRQERIEKTVSTLNNAFDKIDQFLKTQSPRTGVNKQGSEVKSNITDNESAKMKTSKGTIQGFNGIATVDKKHQIIVDAQAFGHGQEQHTLKPILAEVRERFQRLRIRENILKDGVIITADTGFASIANNEYLYSNKINAYIPDNRFRSRDERFDDQKDKYGHRHEENRKSTRHKQIPASEFDFDPTKNTCVCPEGNALTFNKIREDEQGNRNAFFTGKLLDCRTCSRKEQCMVNPESADHRKGSGRQVSFRVYSVTPTYTDWMKARIDSDEGKRIYSHRMSTVEPVFANLEHNKGLKRFSLRGKKKVQTQWQLYAMVHNIEKLIPQIR